MWIIDSAELFILTLQMFFCCFFFSFVHELNCKDNCIHKYTIVIYTIVYHKLFQSTEELTTLEVYYKGVKRKSRILSKERETGMAEDFKLRIRLWLSLPAAKLLVGRCFTSLNWFPHFVGSTESWRDLKEEHRGNTWMG